MSIKGIPIVGLGPGSQPGEDDGATLQYLQMPTGMSTYRRPDVAPPAQMSGFPGAWEALSWLRGALATAANSTGPLLADLSGLDEENRRLVNEWLGEGEVSIHCSGAVRARIQESVLTGVWREWVLDANDRITRDILEVAAIPRLVRDAEPVRTIAAQELERLVAPAGVINAQPILSELAAHAAAYKPGTTAHVINLTLLPMSDADLEFLDGALGRGAVEILSRSYGNCQMTSTAVPNIWWVRYFNSMGTLILNSLEVIDVPLVACAAPEDISDSAGRLEDLLQPQGSRTH
jgi:hydrogenase-1 operon protein HyaF